MSAKTSPLLMKIKNEVASEEIKEYAESAMNELLGWYGYGTVERIDISNNATNKSSATPVSSLLGTTALSNDNNSMNSISTNVSPSMDRHRKNSLSIDELDFTEIRSPKATSEYKGNLTERQADECGWCKRPVSLGSNEFLATPEGPRYCTESCFTQSRRASFKRAKTCDWCKHIRHAVSYVDFQDGASQLQFCSDKCLNQYKMQIFCKETQAHLDLNPHLKDKGKSSTDALITPELWLKSCRSRSISPENSERSKSAESSPILQNSPTPIIPNLSTLSSNQRSVISVAPVEKLLTRSPFPLHQQTNMQSRLLTHHTAVHQSPPFLKRRSQRICSDTSVNNNSSDNNFNNNSNINCNNNCNSSDVTATNSNNNKNHTLSNNNSVNISKEHINKNSTPLISKSASVKPIVDATDKVSFLHRYQLLPPPPPPPNLYSLNASPLHGSLGQSNSLISSFLQIPSCHQPSALPKMALPSMPMQSSISDNANLFGMQQPPVTLLVPYPIVLPFPLPIPVPLPFESFLKAAELKLKRDKLVNNINSSNVHLSTTTRIHSSDSSSSELNEDIGFESIDEGIMQESFVDQPLDFTKSSTKRQIYSIYEPNDLHRCSPTNETVITKSNNSEVCSNSNDDYNAAQHFAKYKITRCNTKRTITKESESSRPLRKRKRVIDCDYLRLKESDDANKLN